MSQQPYLVGGGFLIGEEEEYKQQVSAKIKRITKPKRITRSKEMKQHNNESIRPVTIKLLRAEIKGNKIPSGTSSYIELCGVVESVESKNNGRDKYFTLNDYSQKRIKIDYNTRDYKQHFNAKVIEEITKDLQKQSRGIPRYMVKVTGELQIFGNDPDGTKVYSINCINIHKITNYNDVTHFFVTAVFASAFKQSDDQELEQLQEFHDNKRMSL